MVERLPLVTGRWTAATCDVCGAEGPEILGERHYEVAGRTRRFEMRLSDGVCRSCGFVFAAERPDEDFLMAYYRDAHIGHRGGELHFNAEARAATVARHVPPGGRVVEVGANDGAFTKILKERGFDAFGFDPVEADEARDVTKGFAGHAASSRPAASADAVVAYYVLEHVIAPRQWLSELASYLKPGGVLIVEVPDFDTHPEDSLNMEHLLHFTPSSLDRLLAACGFDLIETPEATMSYGQAAVARLDPAASAAPIDPSAIKAARAAYQRARQAREARAEVARQCVTLARSHRGGA